MRTSSRLSVVRCSDSASQCTEPICRESMQGFITVNDTVMLEESLPLTVVPELAVDGSGQRLAATSRKTVPARWISGVIVDRLQEHLALPISERSLSGEDCIMPILG